MIGIFLCNIGLNYNHVIGAGAASTAGQSVGLLLILTKAS